MIDNDDIFDALADRRRRGLLVGLLDRELHRVPKLARDSEELTDAHEGLRRECLSEDSRARVEEAALLRERHVHLPKLVEYGFVEWDRETDVVTRGPKFDEVKPLLELLRAHREERSPREAALNVPR